MVAHSRLNLCLSQAYRVQVEQGSTCCAEVVRLTAAMGTSLFVLLGDDIMWVCQVSMGEEAPRGGRRRVWGQALKLEPG